MAINYINRFLIIIVILFYIPLAWSEVGTPCPNGDECQPGEICAPGRLAGDPAFCTRRCGPDRPCPDDYICESQGGLALCNTPIEYAQIGEICEPSCDEGLLCLDDGNEEYCSTSCTLPGSCPEGFKCRSGTLNACTKRLSAPSIGEPCTEEEGCSAEYECSMLPNRTISYCTYPCAEIACPDFMVCEGDGEEARCVHLPYQRGLGDTCVVAAQDASTLGCIEPFSCERDRDRHLCTQDCSRQSPCPDGFGCVDRPDSEDNTIGRCIPGEESSPGLEPESPPSMPSTPEMEPEPIPPVNDSNNTMNNTSSMMNNESGGCAVHTRSHIHWLILILFALTVICKRSRHIFLRSLTKAV